MFAFYENILVSLWTFHSKIIHTYTHTHTHIHTHTYIYIYIYTHTHIYIHIHTYTYTHTHIHIHIHTYIHTYTHIHTHIYIYTHTHCPVGWGRRIHQLLLCRGVRPPPISTSILDMTLNKLIVKSQQYWSFGEYRAPLCHCSQVHSSLEW